MDSPKTRRAVIIGATSGIGYEVAQLLLAEGWYLGIAGRRRENLLEFQKKSPDRIKICALDIRKEGAEKRTGETNRGTGRHGFVSTKFRYRFPEF